MRHARRFGMVAAVVAWIGLIYVNVNAGIVPLTFEGLVADADTIFLGRAVDSGSYWEENQSGRFIRTRVVFAVERVYKGPPMIQTSLDFMGGTIGDRTHKVEGMPTFAPGDRDVLFIRSTVRSVNPIVGATFGRFRVVRDLRGLDSVRLFDGSPLTSVTQIGQPQAAPTTQSMSLHEFELHLAQAQKGRRR